ncbi:MAG: thiol-disulfide oxidoreductase DCC family protein [Minwuia sp.]|uniref:thiol-disulfide oxidoreductase DCC family protein n=1 Tax=Minwuia sp. TaxID=2493630 RepID=UPI003A84B733
MERPDQNALPASDILVVMDGECALCSGAARWIARHDSDASFRICTSQSQRGRALMLENRLDPDDPESWLMIEEGRVRTSMDAVIECGRRLGGISRVMAVFYVLPRPARDWIYRRIAQNRYAIFGRGDMCGIPDAELQRRLLP